jgi:hypothetical protein
VFAQSEYQETVTLGGNSYLTEEQSYKSESEQFAITWPVLAGESIKDIAALFYPKNKIMQQRFIDRTLQLSREINPDLLPNTTFNHASTIVVPNIKFLGSYSDHIKSVNIKKKNKDSQFKPILIQSYDVDADSGFGFSSKMHAIYEDLVKRNIKFKLGLEKLNIKLAILQQRLVNLKTDLIRVLDLAFSIADSKNKFIKQQQLMHVTNNFPIKVLSNNQSVKSSNEVRELLGSSNVTTLRSISADSILKYLMLPIAGMLIIIGFSVYFRRQLNFFHPLRKGNLKKNEKKVVVNNNETISQPIPKIETVENPVKVFEFSGSIPGIDSEVANCFDQQKEANLVLEQAKNYISINRIKEAIMLLKTQIQETPKATLHHWFYLLDLYRNSNQKEAFLNNAKQLHEKFNIVMPQWEHSMLSPLVATSLEELPHIVERLTKLWAAEGKNTENMIETRGYLEELLMDNRSTERTGFGIEVFQEIMLLRDILDTRLNLAIKD